MEGYEGQHYIEQHVIYKLKHLFLLDFQNISMLRKSKSKSNVYVENVINNYARQTEYLSESLDNNNSFNTAIRHFWAAPCYAPVPNIIVSSRPGQDWEMKI